MSFVLTDFKTGDSTGKAPSIHCYTSTDALAVVNASGYFNDIEVILTVGDKIYCAFDTDGAPEYGDLKVISITSGVVVTGGVSSGSEIVTTTNVITAAENGKTFYLTLAGGFTSTLPEPFLNGKFKFVVAIDPTTSYIIVTDSGDNIMIGGINELEVDTSSDGPYINNGDTFNFVNALAVVGDYVEFNSNGTSWFFNGQCNVDGGVTLAST